MTGNKCLLDTSIIIHGFRSNNAISSQLDSIEAVFIPTIVIGELYFGAYKSSNPIKHIQQIDSFLLNSKVTVIQIDASIANAYGKIKSELAKKGNQYQKMIFGLLQLQFNIICLCFLQTITLKRLTA